MWDKFNCILRTSLKSVSESMMFTKIPLFTNPNKKTYMWAVEVQFTQYTANAYPDPEKFIQLGMLLIHDTEKAYKDVSWVQKIEALSYVVLCAERVKVCRGETRMLGLPQTALMGWNLDRKNTSPCLLSLIRITFLLSLFYQATLTKEKQNQESSWNNSWVNSRFLSQ